MLLGECLRRLKTAVFRLQRAERLPCPRSLRHRHVPLLESFTCVPHRVAYRRARLRFDGFKALAHSLGLRALVALRLLDTLALAMRIRQLQSHPLVRRAQLGQLLAPILRVAPLDLKPLLAFEQMLPHLPRQP